MSIINLLCRPYQMLFVDSGNIQMPGPQSAPQPDLEELKALQQQSSLNHFDKLSHKIKEEHFRKRTSSQIEDDDLNSKFTGVRKRRNSLNSSNDNQKITDLRSQFVQNPGFCAESAPADNIGSIMRWFQSDWEQRNVGKSPIGLHTHVDSPFSSSSGFTNFRGLLNLGLILLVVSNLRVALENLIKYGILVKPFLVLQPFLGSPDHWTCLSLLLICNVFIAIAYSIERLAERGILKNWSLGIAIIGNLIVIIALPTYIILDRHPNPFLSAPTLGVYCVLFLKLWSYHDVNSWCRQDFRLRRQRGLASARNKSIASALNNLGAEGKSASTSNDMLRYPTNLTLCNLYYFALAPTLCYELNFPRLLRIRRRFLFKRCLELFFLPQVLAALVQQWIVPILRNSVQPLSSSDWPTVLERLLKLAVPNHLIWLLFFYTFFHSALNVLGELLLFGDRSFYRDWWNSDSISIFWTLWNVPVHRFAKRHIFGPLMHRLRINKLLASVIVFAVSAFFHELIVSVPLRMFRLWAFSAMIMQVPLAMLVSRFVRGGQLGNFCVWLSLILGQPLAILMYFHDYYILNVADD